jgi:hypothetical protein
VAKLPAAPPPEELAAIGVRPDEEHRTQARLLRIHRTLGEHVVPWNAFRHHGPLALGRFDPHDPPPRTQEAGVLYAALAAQTCVAEVFQLRRVVNRRRGAPYLTAFTPTRELRLVDLRGAWPTRAGASQAIASGRRDVARGWARSIHAGLAAFDGVVYPSSMDGGRPAFALFERAADAMPGEPDGSWPLGHPALADALAGVCQALGYRLL